MRFIRTFKHLAETPLDDAYTLVEDGLPSNIDEVQAIGRNYNWQNCKLGLCSFDPATGWTGSFAIVYAWKPLTDQIKDIIKSFPKK